MKHLGPMIHHRLLSCTASDTSNKHINRQRNNTIEVTVHTATTTEAPTAGAAIHEMPPQLGSNSQSAVVKPGHSKWSYLDGLDLLFHMPSDLTHYQPHMTNNFVHFNPGKRNPILTAASNESKRSFIHPFLPFLSIDWQPLRSARLHTQLVVIIL